MKYYIDSGMILDRRITPVIYVYVLIIIVITLSLIIFLTIFNYKTYYKVKGVVLEDEDYYIRIYLPLADTEYIVSNDIVRIDGKDYRYNIIMFDSEYITDNNNTYQAVLIKVELPSKYKINNLSLNFSFLKEDKKVIDYIIRRKWWKN